MKRITSLALSAALLASLSTPVLAAPAISVDAAPTAAVLEEENSLWELPQADTPDMSNTVWSFAGGYIDGSEMTQAEMDESLAAYGGTLQFTFDAAGGAKMIQGGGTLNGTYQYLDDGSVGVIFDYNGVELRYACIFTWTDEDELLMVAISDVEGADGSYFVQEIRFIVSFGCDADKPCLGTLALTAAFAESSRPAGAGTPIPR